MTIRTQLRATTIATAVLILVFIGTIFFSSAVVRKAYDRQRVAQQITERSFQSLLLRYEYVQHPSERAKVQWINLYEAQLRLLEESETLFKREPAHSVYEELRSSIENKEPLFSELIRNVDLGASDTIIQELNNQLSMRSQARIAQALRLSELSHDDATAAARNLFAFVTFVGLIVFIISTGSYFVSTKIAASFHILGSGAKKIAEGDLEYRFPIHSSDEIGELSRLFNMMATELAKSQGSLEQRVRQRTKELSSLNRFLDAMIENIPNMIFMKDAKDLKFVRFNKAGEDLLGYKREDLIGKSDLDFFPADQAEAFIKKDRKVLLSDAVVDIPEEPIQTRLKGERWLHTRKVRVCDEHGEPVYLLGISEDITEYKRTDMAKSEFVSLASHQLRTPLTEIRWALSSLSHDALPKEQLHLVTTALGAASHMAETIKAMLTISHIETQEIHPEPATLKLSEVIASTLQLHEMHREKKSLKVTTDCPEGLTLQTDEQLLKEMLSNLITNAYKYTPDGGSVRVKAEKRGQHVEISVTDTGLGIPAAEQSRLFTKFFRASNVVSTKEEGNGIGLYMVYALSKLLGGAITCSSEEHKGTTITLTFPSAL